MARQLADPTLIGPEPIPMTCQEWRRRACNSTRSERVDGEAIPFASPKTVDALISGFLFRLLADSVERSDLGVVIDAPFEMRLERSAREPDIPFIATEHLDRLTPDKLLGPADLVAGPISDDSVARNRRDKLAGYAAGIPKGWRIDPRPGRRRAGFLPLGDVAAYHPAPLDQTGRFRSRVLPGFRREPDRLWREPLPQPSALLPHVTSGDA